MPPEIPFQRDMFTGELVDVRSSKQKKRDEQRAQPRQAEMFSQRELAQFGVRANPKLPISPKTGLELAIEDRRSEEERAEAMQREAEKRTYLLPGVGDAASEAEADHPAETSPVYRQYLEVKQQFPDSLLFFELGDFYETFNEDAEIVARELDIVLVSRAVGRGQRALMAGVPCHSVKHYADRLVEKGYRVAMCERVDDEPVEGVKPREVVRVVMPGLFADDRQASDYPSSGGGELVR